MLAKKNRFTYSELKNFKPKIKFDFDIFTVFINKIPCNEAKHAIAVSKKVTKKAVFRNRIRRRIYNAIKEAGLHNKKGYGFLWKTKKPILEFGYKTILKTVKEVDNKLSNNHKLNNKSPNNQTII